MGYTLLGTLSELQFTQFFHFCFAVHLPACEQCVFFLVFNCFCLGEKAEWFSFWFFCFCWRKAGVLFQYFYTMFFLCHEHFRLCAISTYQVLHPLRSLTGYRLKHLLTTPLGHCFVTEIPFRRVKLSMVPVVIH